MRNHSEELDRILARRDAARRDIDRLDVYERAYRWRDAGDTGLSSMAIWMTMMGLPSERDHPYDPSDLGRCLRLLERIPEWKPRVKELACLSPTWAALVARWDELASLMETEVGFFGENGTRAPKTYRLITEIRDAARKAP